MITAYGIYSEGGQEMTQITTTYREARRVATAVAHQLGETVYLDTLPSSTDPGDEEDCGEAIQPPEVTR